jgi:hypothetical protein
MLPMHHSVAIPKTWRYLLAFLYIVLAAGPARAATGGSISGVTTDPTGAMIAGATLKLVNTAQHTIYQAISDRLGFYSFPNLPVATYDLVATASGFAPQKKARLEVDTDSELRIDITLDMGTVTNTVTVSSASGAQVESSATYLGEVVSAAQMTAPAERQKLYRSARHPTRRGAGLHSSAQLRHHGGRHRRHRSIGRPQPRQPLHQRPARIRQRIHGERNRRSGAHERRHLHHPQPRFHRGVSRPSRRTSIPNTATTTEASLPSSAKAGSNAFHGDAFEFFRNTNLDARATSTPPGPPSTRTSSAAHRRPHPARQDLLLPTTREREP